jgi:hypothetical protein
MVEIGSRKIAHARIFKDIKTTILVRACGDISQ